MMAAAASAADVRHWMRDGAALRGGDQTSEPALVLLEGSSPFRTFTLTEICLFTVFFAGVICILLLISKSSRQKKRIEMLNERIRGLQHGMMQEMKQITKDAKRIQALEKALSKCTDALEMPVTQASLQTMNLIDAVVARGRVKVNVEKKIFEFVEQIKFKGVYVTDAMQQPPPARFEDPVKAKEILGDLAELLHHISGAMVLIEGHTGGGAKAMTDMGFEVAAMRAEKVKETLIEIGVAPRRLEAKACPGFTGDNMFDVKIVTLAWAF